MRLFDKKYRYFKLKLEAAMRKIWEIEFERYILRGIREDKRRELDGAEMRLENILQEIAKTKDPKVTEAETTFGALVKELEDKEKVLEEAKTKEEATVPALEGEVSALKLRRVNDAKALHEMKTDEYKRLEDEKERLTVGIDRLINGREDDKPEAGIRALDILIDGAKPDKDYPNGYQGAKQRIESAYEVIDQIKNYIKGL